MATIAEIKKQYPQYAGIPDKELADALYDKYYANTSKGDFYKAVGYNESWKETLGRAGDNLMKESQDPLNAAKNLGLGVLKGGSDIIDGGAQLLARGAAATSGYVAPGSSVDQFLQDELKKTETYNQDREDRYQSATNGSVLAGVGRVGGNAAVPLGALGGASKVANAATLPSKILSGSMVGGGSAALQPVYDMDQPGASFAGQKTGQVATGVAVGAAAPIVSRVAREAASATGNIIDNPLARAAEGSLVKERGRALFNDSVNPAADAQIIKDLATLKQDPLRYQQVVNGQAAVGRSNAVGIGSDYKDEVINLMKQAGMKDDQISNILNKSQITSADIASLPNTPAGKAASSALTLAVRADAMTKPGVSNSIMAPARWAARTFLPERPASAINTLLGGRTTGEANINALTTPRSVAAADRVLAGGSPADAIGNFETVIQKAMAQKATEAEAKAAQQAAQAGALKEANIAASRIDRTPMGAAFEKLKQYSGLTDDEIVKYLRQLENNPKFAEQVARVRQGETTDDGFIYPIQKAIQGLKKREGGILNQANPGALYQGQNVTVEGIRNPVSYAANVRNAEEAVKIARESAFSPELGQFATSVAGTKSPADKLALIQDRLSKATDPAEIDYINKFVLPLANFGKK